MRGSKKPSENTVTEANQAVRYFKELYGDMRLAEITRRVHDAITGHANKGSVGRDYGRGFSIKPLAKAMAQIEPPVDLTGLAWRVP